MSGRLIIQGQLNRRSAEALMLEIRMLAEACGLEIASADVAAAMPPGPVDDNDKSPDGRRTVSTARGSRSKPRVGEDQSML